MNPILLFSSSRPLPRLQLPPYHVNIYLLNLVDTLIMRYTPTLAAMLALACTSTLAAPVHELHARDTVSTIGSRAVLDAFYARNLGS